MYPMALYVIIQNVVVAAGMVVARLFFPHVLSEATTSVSAWSDLYVTFLTVSAVISTVLFGMLYRTDIRKRAWRMTSDMDGGKRRMTGRDACLIAAASIAFSIAGNNLVNISPLPELSDSYEETSAMLMSGSLVLQLLCVGMLAPIAEELVMRGLLYERLREFMKPKWAIFLGGVLFGVFHGNLVQGIYAACCGWFLCWLMETYHSLKATVLSHMVSNLAVTLIVSTSLYNQIMVFWIVTAAAAAVFALAIFRLATHQEVDDQQTIE